MQVPRTPSITTVTEVDRILEEETQVPLTTLFKEATVTVAVITMECHEIIPRLRTTRPTTEDWVSEIAPSIYIANCLLTFCLNLCPSSKIGDIFKNAATSCQ